MRYCPTCHQRIAVERFGARLTPLKAGIVDLIKAAGDEGISSREILASELYHDRLPHSREWSPHGIKAHVSQINEVIADAGVLHRVRSAAVVPAAAATARKEGSVKDAMCLAIPAPYALDFTRWQMCHLRRGVARKLRSRPPATVSSKGRNPAMEPTSFVRMLSQAEDRFGETLRKGQSDVIKAFIVETEKTAQLPTGLGKTRAAAGAYAMLRVRDIANRMLYIVPRSKQAKQAATEVPADLGVFLNEAFKSYILGDTPVPALKAHRSGACQIFITTVQALVSGGNALKALREMMGTGKWFIVIDEYHHYGEADKAWTAKIKSLPHQALLALSATPHRKDEAAPFGEPTINIRYRDARELGYLKELLLHAYDYRVDAMVNNVDIETFTTSEIYEAAGSLDPAQVDRWVATRELRWSPQYISPLVKTPIARLLSYPFRAQMLVQAICCSHAKMVCEQIKGLVGPNIRVDWVGTGPNGRSDAENDALLHEFCPDKDSTGKRPWTLDILVNVGMAGEGLDSMDVCEVVFLNAPNLNNTTLQVIGRAARLPKGTTSAPRGIINVDEACEMAKYIGHAIETCFDEVPVPGTDRNGGNGNGGDYLIPPFVVIKETTGLVDIRTDPHYAPVLAEALSHGSTRGLAQDVVEQIVEKALREGLQRRNAVFNASAEILRYKNYIENGCRLKAFQIQGMLRKTGRMHLTEYQHIIKRIKSKKNHELGSRPEDCSLEELKRHEEWLKQFEGRLKAGLPPWLV